MVFNLTPSYMSHVSSSSSSATTTTTTTTSSLKKKKNRDQYRIAHMNNRVFHTSKKTGKENKTKHRSCAIYLSYLSSVMKNQPSLLLLSSSSSFN
ncbi:hypothetical protein DERF_006023 [Dermatophagoides farinae]|uniref:Uncharacterized protein n=1 Tax=Dermatophagoides farinae TaxID=6954 RepID=A0A922I5A5_DERFA|nr:hypothetical protein DERF_006023 [Dermatophagoides farinae]